MQFPQGYEQRRVSSPARAEFGRGLSGATGLTIELGKGAERCLSGQERAHMAMI
jgi:hypothetical protein